MPRGPQWQFDDHHPRYKMCCIHVRYCVILLTVITLILCIGVFVLSILALISEGTEEYFFENIQIQYEYDQRKDTFILIYKIGLGLTIVGSVLHFCCLILVFIGLQRIKSIFCIPELVALGLFIGLLLFAVVSMIILMIIVLGFIWKVTTIICIMLLYLAYYTYVLLICYRYLRDKHNHEIVVQANRVVRFTRN